MDPVLVVGATGILRPAVRSLSAAGRHVVAVARSAGDLHQLAVEVRGVVPLAQDCLDPDALGGALSVMGLEVRAGIAYCPAADRAVLRGLAAVVGGPLVHLLPSAWAAPGGRRPRVRGPVLQLGWTGDPPRWHTPDEVSAAALAVLASGDDAVLGRVRPWTDRPA
jgi:hypothetical protein